MIQRLILFFTLVGAIFFAPLAARAADANRLTYLDETDPFYVSQTFPKLITPQWVGQPGVEAVILLGLDDLGTNHAACENFLRPILQRLKKINGRAPVSIFCNRINPEERLLQKWLAEGVSLEAHTLAHPCPLLGKDFASTSTTFHSGVDLVDRVLGNHAVAFRAPCCDSMNSASPRFFAELFNRTSPAQQFLALDSSVMNLFSSADKSLPRELVLDPDGRERFRRYLPPGLATTIENYPYPYLVGKLCWEFPATAPSDWQAQRFHGPTNAATLADWKSALDATVLKQGVMNVLFHPHGWIRPEQLVEFIDYAHTRYGKKILFLNFQDAEARLRKNLLQGRSLRALNGQDNGVRLLDLNDDGFLDVISANELDGQTLLWHPAENKWASNFFPMALVAPSEAGERQETGVKFGIVRGGRVSLFKMDEASARAWTFNGEEWSEDNALLRGLVLDGQPILTCAGNRRAGRRDHGARLRDVDNDGRCEFIISNEKQNAIFSWSERENSWQKLSYALPTGVAIVNAAGGDNGLRFIDVNGDGLADALFSNAEKFSLHLFVAKESLDTKMGWTREVVSGKRGATNEIPMIVRGGAQPNNGAWFHERELWVQNEHTASLTNGVARRSFDQVLTGTLFSDATPTATSRTTIPAGGLSEAVAELLITGLKDIHPQARLDAIRLSEPFLRGTNLPAPLESALVRLAADPDPRVRAQLASALGQWTSPRAAPALAQLAMQDGENRDMQSALLNASSNHVGEILGEILRRTNFPPALARQFLHLAAARSDDQIFLNILAPADRGGTNEIAWWHMAALAEFLDALEQRGRTYAQFRDAASGDLRKVLAQTDKIFARAREVADAKKEQDELETIAAARVLGRDVTRRDDDVKRLGQFLNPEWSNEIQGAALDTLRKLSGTNVAKVIVLHWKNLTPILRGDALDLLLARTEWRQILLKAIESNQISVSQMGAGARQKLLASSDPALRERAAKLFSGNATEPKFPNRYAGVTKLKGDAAKGRVAFQKTCVLCHRFHDEGNSLGPDLAVVSERAVPFFLAAIFDPNRTINTRYATCAITTQSGGRFSGIVASETRESVTLKNIGVEKTVLRSELKELTVSAISLMPNFVNRLDAQTTADLIAYLKSKPAVVK